MNFKQYWNKTFRESSIHGFPYLVRQELHWLEKIFWVIIIIVASYTSIDICLNQWKRFRDNPIVYAMELAWGKSNLPFVGITLCSEATNPNDVQHIIEDTWGVTQSQNNTRYQYYMDFLNVVNSLNTLNLKNLKPYENDLSLRNLKYLEILFAMRKKFLPAKKYNNEENSEPTEPSLSSEKNKEDLYAAAITEMGLCRTTSQMTHHTNPFGESKSLKVVNKRYCDIINECNAKIVPNAGDDSELLILLHNVEDIVTPHDQGSISRSANAKNSMTIELLLNLMVAEAEVRNLPIAFRKCRYRDENNLKYFEIYRPSLCRIECRVNVAMEICHCKPYFYAIARHLPVCDVQGMLCLAQEDWPNVAQCNCPSLCEEESYVSMQTTLQKDESTKFESTIIVKLFMQRMAVKRRVVFSTDQLIMSFGGAIGLFLGASFISVYGLLYTLSEYVFAKILSCYRNKRNSRKRHIQLPHTCNN